MAAPFVPVPFPVDWTEVRRSWTKRGSPIHTSISWVRGVGPSGAAAGAPTPVDSWTRPRVGMLDGPKDEGSLGDSWVERPITPTLLDYEILEERAKFTVYKILVTGSQGDSWVIFRRYTDFCRLNDKLKELFPSFALALPPKRWFKDNYDEEFLEERQIGLQTFLQNLTLHVDITSSEAVRHFLRLVDPPSPFDSLEESRAFCETLEETNHRLQRELQENQREVDTLKKTLEENHMRLLVNKVKSPSLSSESFKGPCRLTASIATDTSTHREGDTDANGFKQKDTDGNEGVDDERGYSVTEADKESNHGTR